MDKERFKLSVVVRAYNQEKEVVRALKSIVSQTFDSLVEIIVGIDVSTDRTIEVVQEFCKTLPHNFTASIISHKERMGGGKNLMTCLCKCQGEYVTILDGDDYWIDRNMCSKLCAILDEKQEVGLAYGNFIIECPYIPEGRKEEKRADPGNNIFTQLLEGNFLGTNISIFRRSLLKFVDWDVFLAHKWSQDDYFIWLEFANHAKFYHIPDFVAVYTVVRNIVDDNILYESDLYDVTTTEVKEYYLNKYPNNTSLSKSDILDSHYKMRFRTAVLLGDYSYAMDAFSNMSYQLKQNRYYKLLSHKLVWYIYIYYRKLKHGKRNPLQGYFD